jgi:CrcB protein
MNEPLLVAIGGAIGALLRFKVSSLVNTLVPNALIPYGTLLVNGFGCFLAGVFAAAFLNSQVLGIDLKPLVLVGVLGGFTTFSAFGVETISLVHRGESGVAVAYVLISLLIGFGAVWLGFKLVSS